MVHDFNERNEWSHSQQDEPFWDTAYRMAFPDMVGTLELPKDSESQRQGVDRLVHLSNGKTLYIDEKKRSGNYGDILLEYISNTTRNTPGWIAKPLLIDYLAYAIMPTSTVYFLPWLMLQKAWRDEGSGWIDKASARTPGYTIVDAQNYGYTTRSVAVPVDTIYHAVNRAFRIQVPV